MIDEERFFAWLDGELDETESASVAAAVAASPELTARAEQHRALSAGLRNAFDPIVDAKAPMPAFGDAEVIDLGARATERERRRGWPSVPQWGAMAASLALGLILGTQFIRDPAGPSPVGVQDARLVAAASLEAALHSQLASAPAEDIRIGLTFRNSAGEICRSFSDRAMTGLACRSGEDWQIRGLFQPGEGQASDYRMAAGTDPRLAQLVDATISGEPFDEAAERAARDRGWR